MDEKASTVVKNLDLIIPCKNDWLSLNERLIELSQIAASIRHIYICIDSNELAVEYENLIEKYKDLSLFLVINNKESGFKNAILSGFEASSAKWVCVYMADGSDRVEDLECLINRSKTSNARMIFAFRKKFSDNNLLKNILRILGHCFLKYKYKIPSGDLTNNFRCYNREFALKFLRKTTANFSWALEIALENFEHTKNVDYIYINTNAHARKFGHSKFTLSTELKNYLRLLVS